MRLGQFPANGHELRGHQSQSAPLKTGNHFTDQSALDTIGFNKYQRSFHNFLQKMRFTETRFRMETWFLVSAK
jgi:hypothetical protein